MAFAISRKGNPPLMQLSLSSYSMMLSVPPNKELRRHMMPCSISQIGSNHLYRNIYRQDTDLVYQRYVLFLEEGCRL